MTLSGAEGNFSPQTQPANCGRDCETFDKSSENEGSDLLEYSARVTTALCADVFAWTL